MPASSEYKGSLLFCMSILILKVYATIIDISSCPSILAHSEYPQFHAFVEQSWPSDDFLVYAGGDKKETSQHITTQQHVKTASRAGRRVICNL